jgi:hypothetical protein
VDRDIKLLAFDQRGGFGAQFRHLVQVPHRGQALPRMLTQSLEFHTARKINQ